ncbi:MAG: UDP-N-acetylglucosamine 1-carboxyvinyltransferase [Pirellulales bacterium]|nr:UDP-N-acetylglucosamine 1-carboxyvinyltransferase [Pirellulales bacterium]
MTPTPLSNEPAAFLRIGGGRALRGQVAVAGAKNAALPMMAAGILGRGATWLEGVPELGDVEILGRVLQTLGVAVGREPDGRLRIEPDDRRAGQVRAGYELVRRMRASFCVLGPLLARRGRAEVALPGGCAIGDRPVDLHLAALAAMGATIEIEHGYVVASARRLVGTRVSMTGPRGPSVTGTANVLSAATLARGETTITGAAVEPEIVDLGRMLVAMGAKIDGLGTPTLRIEGVDTLSGITHRVIPDRIEAATLLLAAAITQGDVTVTGCVPEHIAAVLETLRAVGCKVEVYNEETGGTGVSPVENTFHGQDARATQAVRVSMSDRPRSIDIVAKPYPGVPTDVQAQWMALLALADGTSTIQDRVFPGRFMHVAELARLGARIEATDGRAVISGVDRLSGADVRATDLRAGAALVLAGLAAEGQTTVTGLEHLDRGYERLDSKLASLEAQIERVDSIA